MQVGRWLSETKESVHHYLWNTRSERAQFNTLTQEASELSSRIEALQAPKLTVFSKWVKPLLHRATLGYAFAPVPQVIEKVSLCSELMQLLLYRMTGGYAYASTLSVLRFLYQGKQQELNLCNQALQKSAAIRMQKVAHGFVSVVAIGWIIGMFAITYAEDQRRQRGYRRRYDDWRRGWESWGGGSSSTSLPALSRPADWEKKSVPDQVNHLKQWIHTLQNQGISLASRCKASPFGDSVCAFSRKEGYNAWIQPLLKTETFSNQGQCAKKTIKACKKFYATVRPDTTFSEEEQAALPSLLKKLGWTIDDFKKNQREVAAFIGDLCPLNQRSCKEMLEA